MLGGSGLVNYSGNSPLELFPRPRLARRPLSAAAWSDTEHLTGLDAVCYVLGLVMFASEAKFVVTRRYFTGRQVHSAYAWRWYWHDSEGA